jgi:hypothetical protein
MPQGDGQQGEPGNGNPKSGKFNGREELTSISGKQPPLHQNKTTAPNKAEKQ